LLVEYVNASEIFQSRQVNSFSTEAQRNTDAPQGRKMKRIIGKGLWLLPLLGIQAAVVAAPARKSTKPVTKTVAKPAVSPTDPQRWSKVKEWTGNFSISMNASGDKQQDYARVTWTNSVIVEGKFTLKPHYDHRNGDPFSLRGKGQAYVIVKAVRKTQYSHEVITNTYDGSYVDTFNVELGNFDYQRGTYQMSVIRDLWQLQPHKGEAINHLEVKVNRYGTYRRTSITPGHSWADDGGAGFGRDSPLPKTGLIIKGSMTSNNGQHVSADPALWKTNWTIRPSGPEFDEPLKAIAGGPYSNERGQSLTLNGSKSTGKIRSYKWTFAPANANSPIPFNAGAHKQGAMASVVLLAPVKATLTVSDGKKEDSDTVVLNVKARDFKTPFVHRESEKLHPRSIPPRMIKGRDLKYAGGENVCALDDYGAKDSIHILHPNEAGGTWEDRGYKLEQVKDPNGPFDGNWYLSEYSIKVERETLLNKYILPGGPPPVRTAKPFYESNKALGNDVDGYIEAVRKHEMLHTQLMQKALKAGDPGPKIEALVSKNKEDVKTQADQTIKGAEDAIDQASADPLPSVGWKGKIAFPDDATDKYIPLDMEI
jgi:hypothetical protein